jgi:hypothetical protein
VSSNVFSNLAAGTYTAYVKDARGCIAQYGNIVLTAPSCTLARSANPPSITSSLSLSLKVFPNPSTDQFSLIATSENSREVTVIVTDLLGRRIVSTRTVPNTLLIFGKELMKGTYVVEALQGKERATMKIIKEK